MVKIPTNGPDTLFFNGHAATEGILTLSADHRLLAFAGYGGTDLLATQGTPSLLDFKRGFCTVDATGLTHTLFYRQHGGEDEKMNPRGVVTDGHNSFWGCGNALGTVYCNPTAAMGTVTFLEIPTTRSIKILDHPVKQWPWIACPRQRSFYSLSSVTREADCPPWPHRHPPP